MNLPDSVPPAGAATLLVAAVPSRAAISRLTRALPLHEQRRAAAFNGHRRAEFVAGRILARGIAGRLLGLHPSLVPLKVDDRGKPHLSRPAAEVLSLGITHAGGRVGLAIAGPTAVGVDFEPTVDPSHGAVRWTCSPGEFAALVQLPASHRAGAFMRLWTVKEACLKAQGLGIRQRLSRMDVGLPAHASNGQWADVRWRSLQRPGLTAAVALISDGCPSNPAEVSSAEIPTDVIELTDLEALS